MKEIDKINLFIQYLVVTGKFSSQEDVGKYIGYANKSSFSQMLKKDVTPPFREKFYKSFPEFENFHIGFIEDETTNKLLIQKGIDETIKNIQERQIEALTDKIDHLVKDLGELKKLIKH
ncbi:hypothetical protein [Chryseobacterium sp. WX]|uniref:hypothetical protein n=1 Tax=Chryseobacterium sp. WX TaxID=3031803 RepID=UPI00240A39C2|nr:hypothetical protein [Chryseobacterium sp. WX]WFB67022.1 hypothetical protein PZ898_20260 [Chryseobacterium sp. WX]